MEPTAAQLQSLRRAFMSADIPDDDVDQDGPASARYGPNTASPMPVCVVSLNRAAAQVPPGWRDLLTRTHYKLIATICECPVRRRAADSITVIITDQELDFKLRTVSDSVLRGILRKATARSRCTCNQCGRRGRVRSIGDDYVGTLCARCAAVPLLREHIASVLQQREHFVLFNQSVGLSQVPEHLWPVFQRWADLPPAADAHPMDARMSIRRYVRWTQYLEALNPWLPSHDFD